MREVKFRGLSVETGKWLYGVPLISGNDAFIITVDNRFCDLSSSVIKDSVGQYTGLKDKNNVEIYEGDIIRFYRQDDYNEGEEREGISEVVYSSQLTAFCYFYQVKGLVFEKGKSKVISALGGVYDQCGYIKIIGNIYEDNHLLEGEE